MTPSVCLRFTKARQTNVRSEDEDTDSLTIGFLRLVLRYWRSDLVREFEQLDCADPRIFTLLQNDQAGVVVFCSRPYHGFVRLLKYYQ
jgi:hypothetical protein